MVGEAVGAAWSGVQGWFTPAVLFLLVNLVVGTIAVASRLMPSPSSPAEDDGGGRLNLLLRAPSLAADRLRCFSFSRLGLAADHAPVDEGAAAGTEPPLERPAVGGVERGQEHEPARIERSRSEAAAEAPARLLRERRRVRKPAMAHLAPADDGHGTSTATAREAIGGAVVARHVDGEADDEEPPAVEVDARADDFIRRFREQLRLQRLDSILRYRDTLRRTGTA